MTDLVTKGFAGANAPTDTNMAVKMEMMAVHFMILILLVIQSCSSDQFWNLMQSVLLNSNGIDILLDGWMSNVCQVTCVKL